MSKFLNILRKKILVIDGAMGTQLMQRGVRPEDNFDLQNIIHPALVEDVHRAYVTAGADIIETNTFGANTIKLAEYKLDNRAEEINAAAVKIAKKAAGRKAFVCGSVGPLGALIDPLGPVTFDQAYVAFARQAKALELAGADMVSIETISDLQEMRAAVVAVKQETKLPIIASLTFDEGEKTIYGTTPEAATVVLEALGVDILSANCSTGPEGMLKVARRFLAASRLPIMVMPNAGMPELVGGKAIYKMTPRQFAAYAVKFAKLGVRIIGGCCGTSPDHIREVKSQISNLKSQNLIATTHYSPLTTHSLHPVSFSSRDKVVHVKEDKLLLVGERINPTGRKLFQEEIKAGKGQILRQEAEQQTLAGADLLDTNISVPATPETENMHRAVKLVQSASHLPLSIDSPSPAAVEEGLKIFCGRALLNSINGKKESFTTLLPLAKKYGAAVIALALDEKGVPETANQRLAIARRIVQAAVKAGIEREAIFVDNLVMTVGVGIEGALETLRAIPLVKKALGVKTILGISNVSHGMPMRADLNALYLQLARAYGLDAAIVDVTDEEVRKAARRRVTEKDKAKLLRQFQQAVEKAKASGRPAEKKREAQVKAIKFHSLSDIKNTVIAGDVENTLVLVQQALDEQKIDPQKIIDGALVAGMEVVGEKFGRKEFFLPQVLEAAEAMRRGFEICKERIPLEAVKKVGKVILATVKGDVHDIGKNIVRMLLENHGFEVIDLGKDISAQEIIAAAKRERPQVIALSALLTTTMVEMEVVKQALGEAGLDIPLIVGGAVVTENYAQKIGADYSLDAVGAVQLAKKIVEEGKNKA